VHGGFPQATARGEVGPGLSNVDMEYRPPRKLGTATGAIATGWSLALSLLLLSRGLTADISLSTLWPYLAAAFFFGLAVLFGYWTYGCYTLRYVINRNGLAIRWGAIRQLIPLDQIEWLVEGRQAPEPRVDGVNWPGHHVGRAAVRSVGDTLFYSTHRSREDLLYLVTPSQSYGLSVTDVEGFGRDIQEQRDLGPHVPVRQSPERYTVAAQPFWSDGVAQVLALAAILGCVVVFGYVFARYPGLAPTIPLRFPPMGGVTRVASKEQLLTLPVTALGILVLNLGLAVLVHTWERAAGYLLLLAAAGLQVAFLVGAIVALA
jgi:hypothetical protein